MTKRTKKYEELLFEELKDPKAAVEYLNASLHDGDRAIFLLALRDVAVAHGMSEIAEEAGLGRQSLYKTLSGAGNPKFETVVAILGSIGIEMSLKPKKVG